MIDQIGILTLGVAAIRLSQDRREHVAKWACICGLAGQPFWFYASWTAGQWGILLSCCLYTWAWWQGVRRFWWRRR